MDLRPGNYVTPELTLVELLGEGAMGSVWVAEHRTLGQRVAVKFIAAKRARNTGAVARFEREASSAAQLDDPHVVRIIEHGTTSDGSPYLAMELLEGESLGERLTREGTMSLGDTVRVAAQVGGALDRAHAAGIVHRDIKPDNLFLVRGHPELFVKVLDFGAAKQWREQQEALTRTGVLVGTPEYMSPEQVLGSKGVDYRTDLWSLAAVAYRMLVGRVPFAADTPHALFFSICKGEFGRLSGSPAPLELEPWFGRAFASAKAKRFGSAGEMVQQLERAAAQAVAASWPGLSAGLDYEDEATELIAPARHRPPTPLDEDEDGPRTAKPQPAPRRSTPGAGAGSPPPSADALAVTLSLEDDVDDQAPTAAISPERVAELMADASLEHTLPVDEWSAAPADGAAAASPGQPAAAPRGALPPPRPPMPSRPGRRRPPPPRDPAASRPPQPSSPRLAAATEAGRAPDSELPLPPPPATSASGREVADRHSESGLRALAEIDRMVSEALSPGDPAACAPAAWPLGQQDGAAEGAARAAAGGSWPRALAPAPAPAPGEGPASTGQATPPGLASNRGVAVRHGGKRGRRVVVWVLAAALVMAAAMLVGWRTGVLARMRAAAAACARPTQQPAPAAATPSSAVQGAAAQSAPTPAPSSVAAASASASSEEAFGYLSVVCQPECAQIWLGNVPLGHSPVRRHRVEAGRHRLALSAPHHKLKVTFVQVRAGEHLTRRALLLPEQATGAGSAGPGPAASASSAKTPAPPIPAPASAAPAGSAPKSAPKVDEIGF